MIPKIARIVTRAVSTVLVVGGGPAHPQGNNLFETFIERANRFASSAVIELGTKRMIESVKTKHDD